MISLAFFSIYNYNCNVTLLKALDALDKLAFCLLLHLSDLFSSLEVTFCASITNSPFRTISQESLESFKVSFPFSLSDVCRT